MKEEIEEILSYYTIHPYKDSDGLTLGDKLLTLAETSKDYIVVKDSDTAEELARQKNPPESMRGKTIIVAPDGIEFVSKEDILKLPAMKEIIETSKREAYQTGFKDGLETGQKLVDAIRDDLSRQKNDGGNDKE